MFNFEPFDSNRPGQTRGHLKDEDGNLLAFYAMSVHDDLVLGSYTRIAAEMFFPNQSGKFRYSASTIWASGMPRIKDEGFEDALVHKALPLFTEIAA
jgi:hypothetical protein